MKEKKIFRKPRVNGLKVPIASKKSSKGSGRSETEVQKVVIRQQDKIYCPEILKEEKLLVTLPKVCNVTTGVAMTGCNGVEGITGIEKFKQLRDQGFEWITHTALVG